jgi:hypothetical protein
MTYGQTLAEHQTAFQTLTNQGFRPICLDVDGTGTASSYSAAWVKDGFVDWVSETELNVEECKLRVAFWKTAGYRVLTLDSHGSFPDELYTVLWVKDKNAADYRVEFRNSAWPRAGSLNLTEYPASWVDVNMSSGTLFGTVYFRFRPSSAGTIPWWKLQAMWWAGMKKEEVFQTMEELAPRAWPAVVHSQGTSFAAIWLDEEVAQARCATLRLNQSGADLGITIEQLWREGYQPVSVTQHDGKYNSVWRIPASLDPPRSLSLGKSPDQKPLLRIWNAVPKDRSRFMELIPVQRSTNLVDWEPLVTLIRTNADPAPTAYSDPQASKMGQCFYRISTNRYFTPLLTPTGPFGVGEFSETLVDPARWDWFTMTNLQFTVTCWYPASPQGGITPMSYTDSIGSDCPNYLSGLASRFVCHSLDRAPIASNIPSLYPTIWFFPNTNAHRRLNLIFAEELASHGFVVIGLDYQTKSGGYYGDAALADGRTILNQLELWQSAHPVLAGHLDLQHVGAFGCLLGGSKAVGLADTAPNCCAAANLDGVFDGARLIASGCTNPVLVIRSDTPDPEFAGDNRLAVFQLSKAPAYYLKLAGTVSESFGENGLLLDLPDFNRWYQTTNTTDGYRAQDLVRTALVSFFKRHLKGEEDGGLKRLAESPADVSLALELNGNTLNLK